MRLRHPHLKIILAIVIALSLYFTKEQNASAQKWQGVDESVVEKVAEEHGRPAWRPFINTDQGDLLLFVFLLAGAVGGFICGFYWRKLFYPPSSAIFSGETSARCRTGRMRVGK